MLETARLRLRTWDAADVQPFMARLNTPAVMQWLGGVNDEPFYQATYQRIADCQAAHGHSFWIVERSSDDALLGFCGIKRTNVPGAPFQNAHEIGWRLAQDAWGHGYAREAAEACLTDGFTRLAAAEIVAITVRQNAASWGLMQRLGFTRARDLDFVDTRMPADLANNTITYRLARTDWTH
jgi:RimJ/RimL family protein N-acetyltransferase